MRTRIIRMALLSASLVIFVSTSLGRDSQFIINGPMKTAKEETALVERLKTSEDHMKLARYFSQEADQFEADARQHEEMMIAYHNIVSRGTIETLGAEMITERCKFLAKSEREIAKTLLEIAATHLEMAREAGKK